MRRLVCSVDHHVNALSCARHSASGSADIWLMTCNLATLSVDRLRVLVDPSCVGEPIARHGCAPFWAQLAVQHGAMSGAIM